jgi:hypothetical protein
VLLLTAPPPPAEQPVEPARFWVSADFLLWWIKDGRLPALVTTGPLSDRVPGAPGARGTEVLIGGGDVDDGVHPGGRFSAGYWFAPDQSVGIEGSYLFLISQTTHISAHSTGGTGEPILTLQGLNSGLLAEAGLGSVIATPQLTRLLVDTSVQLAGSGGVRIAIDNLFQSAEINGTATLVQRPGFRFNILGGFRYLNFQECLSTNVDSSLTLTATNPLFRRFLDPPFGAVATQTISERDDLDTCNDFYGGQIGCRAQFERGRLSLDVVGKLALGATRELVWADSSGSVSGIVTTQGEVLGLQPGLSAPYLFSRSGEVYHADHTRFAVVPEFGLTAGYQITDALRATMGYSFIYWSRVSRPGQELDHALTGARRDTDFWAQGLSWGLEYSF